MTREEALKILEKTESDYNQKNRIVRGLQTLAKYDDKLDSHIGFEHDQMYASDFDETVTQMSKEDVIEMALCGWFESEDSWSHF